MKLALCIGSASGVWDDLEAFAALGVEPDVTIGVNRFARDYPYSLDGWTSYHPELFHTWVTERRNKGLPDHKAYFTCRNGGQTYIPKGLHPFDTFDPVGGSSGLGAVECAFSKFGADRVVIAGIRIDSEAGHFNYGVDADVKERWREGQRYQRNWRCYPEEKRARMRSLSGWTREILGSPDEAFAKGE